VWVVHLIRPQMGLLIKSHDPNQEHSVDASIPISFNIECPWRGPLMRSVNCHYADSHAYSTAFGQEGSGRHIFLSARPSRTRPRNCANRFMGNSIVWTTPCDRRSGPAGAKPTHITRCPMTGTFAGITVWQFAVTRCAAASYSRSCSVRWVI